mgnify:CR=1 FL=1
MTHGHKYNVKWTTKYLYEQASKLGADIIVYGHSHVGNEEHVNDKIIINPGSVFEPRDGLDPSFMIIDINNEKINLQRIIFKIKVFIFKINIYNDFIYLFNKIMY